MSSYVETLLTPEETILSEAKQHWVALIRYALQPILILGAAIIGLLIGQWLAPSGSGLLDGLVAILDTIVGLVTLGLFVLAIVWLPIQAVRWLQRRFVVTNRRVICASGLLRRTSQEARLEKITDVGYMEGFLGRQMGFGDLNVSTASGPMKLDDIIGALEFKKVIMAAQEGMVRERAAEIMGSRLAPVPTPVAQAADAATLETASAADPVPTDPVPAAFTPAVATVGSAAAPAAAPIATAGRADADIERAESPEEITALLARLADLRDSGAISPEEYEAKKQELLERL